VLLSLETENQLRANGLQFRFQPRSAGMDLFHAGFLVDVEFAARLPPEVLHSIVT
jgi:hypothetical protein